ncbi:MAG: hypothetical protein ACPG5B_02210 [Chitinophagales bacterium]
MTSLIEQLQGIKFYQQQFQNQVSVRQFLHKAKLSNYLLISFESDAFFRIENRQIVLGRRHDLHWLISKNVELLIIREDLKMLEKPIELLAAFIKNVQDDIELESMPKDVVLLAPNHFVLAYKKQVSQLPYHGVSESVMISLAKENEKIPIINSPIQDYLILTSLSNLKGENILLLDENNALLCNNPQAVFYTKL